MLVGDSVVMVGIEASVGDEVGVAVVWKEAK